MKENPVPAWWFPEFTFGEVLEELRDSRCYRDDPPVKRVLGLKRLPDVAMISRMLKHADARSVKSRLLQALTRLQAAA